MLLVLTAMADAVTARMAADVVCSPTQLCRNASCSSTTSAPIWVIIGSLGHCRVITFDKQMSLVIHSVLRSNDPTIWRHLPITARALVGHNF